ncbi:hypothetical protein [Enterococcus sp. AZ196]|uniref:hypothetical protein n=1 Tax=Enterococcus sp. AZ196 TaxID=2774659 RepID=UPI003D2D2BF0
MENEFGIYRWKKVKNIGKTILLLADKVMEVLCGVLLAGVLTIFIVDIKALFHPVVVFFFKVVIIVSVIAFVGSVIGQILLSISEKNLRSFWQNKK